MSGRPIDQDGARHRVAYVPRDRSQVEHGFQLFHSGLDVRLFERQRPRLRGLALRLVELQRQVAGRASQPFQLATQVLDLRWAWRGVCHAPSTRARTRSR